MRRLDEAFPCRRAARSALRRSAAPPGPRRHGRTGLRSRAPRQPQPAAPPSHRARTVAAGGRRVQRRALRPRFRWVHRKKPVVSSRRTEHLAVAGGVGLQAPRLRPPRGLEGPTVRRGAQTLPAYVHVASYGPRREDQCAEPAHEPAQRPQKVLRVRRTHEPSGAPRDAAARSPWHAAARSPWHAAARSPWHAAARSPWHAAARSPWHAAARSPWAMSAQKGAAACPDCEVRRACRPSEAPARRWMAAKVAPLPRPTPRSRARPRTWWTAPRRTARAHERRLRVGSTRSRCNTEPVQSVSSRSPDSDSWA